MVLEGKFEIGGKDDCDLVFGVECVGAIHDFKVVFLGLVRGAVTSGFIGLLKFEESDVFDGESLTVDLGG